MTKRKNNEASDLALYYLDMYQFYSTKFGGKKDLDGFFSDVEAARKCKSDEEWENMIGIDEAEKHGMASRFVISMYEDLVRNRKTIEEKGGYIGHAEAILKIEKDGSAYYKTEL